MAQRTLIGYLQKQEGKHVVTLVNEDGGNSSRENQFGNKHKSPYGLIQKGSTGWETSHCEASVHLQTVYSKESSLRRYRLILIHTYKLKKKHIFAIEIKHHHPNTS